jgi:type IV pilus assembly protein PilE
MRRRLGFTIMELMVAIVVLAILVAVAMPSYDKAMRRTHWNSTRDLLQVIYSGEQVYWTANNQYKAAAAAADWPVIYVEDPNAATQMPVTFAVVTNGLKGAAATFKATATYTPTGETQTVDQTRTFGGTWAMP